MANSDTDLRRFHKLRPDIIFKSLRLAHGAAYVGQASVDWGKALQMKAGASGSKHETRNFPGVGVRNQRGVRISRALSYISIHLPFQKHRIAA